MNVCPSFQSERKTNPQKNKRESDSGKRGTDRSNEERGTVSSLAEKNSGKLQKAKNSDTVKDSVKRKNKTEDVVLRGACGIRYCDDKYKTDWIRWQMCITWYHNKPQGLPEKSQLRRFVCVSCENSD